MTKEEINQSLVYGDPLFWKDPDPISGVDYKITHIEVGEEISLIQYNGGSEAEVFNHEIVDAL
jgi:hypothetical protein